MAHQLHWTRDSRFTHLRYPPSWYHQEPRPYYTPRPSARMEKLAAEERRREWQWQASDGVDAIFAKSCCEATFWPCGIYSRASLRLRTALSGVDVLNPPPQSCVNPDCVQFAACLPFYGCFFAKMQTTLRSFYNIEGSDVSDWFDGYCCPCLTIVRAEHEVLFRERQLQQLANLREPTDSPYKSHTSMSYDDVSVSRSSGAPSRAPAAEGKNVDHNKKGLPVIPEASTLPGFPSIMLFSPAELPQPSEPLKDETNKSSPSRPTSLTRRLSHSRNSPTGKENAPALPRFRRSRQKSKDTSDKTESGPKKEEPGRQGIDTTTIRARSATQSLDKTNATPMASPHGLEEDHQVTDWSVVAAAHKLADDGTLTVFASPVPHELGHDSMAVRTPSSSPHELKEDVFTRKPAMSSAHRLQEDKKMPSKTSSARQSHALEDHGLVNKAPRFEVHHLEDDVISLAPKSSPKTHSLEHDEGAAYHASVVVNIPHRRSDAKAAEGGPKSTPLGTNEEGATTAVKIIVTAVSGDAGAAVEPQGRSSRKSTLARSEQREDTDTTIKLEETRTALYEFPIPHILSDDALFEVDDDLTLSNVVSKATRLAIHQLHDDSLVTMEDDEVTSNEKLNVTPTHILAEDALATMEDQSTVDENPGMRTHELGDDSPIPLPSDAEMVATPSTIDTIIAPKLGDADFGQDSNAKTQK
ncbi:hypothetical protein S7711_08649 [Stachybotrys chartarum IBT 7711]|uniref:Uncharacterized protein n=1 Tax=Stachybotrys chartarum (strain CBS 109288 / IBT 7711) TaxID=1280523 RepID=A0A084AXT9_STACB|nr:hypothetical protein S7711_08649 [Stachybotrys chartarum IBT 7711]